MDKKRVIKNILFIAFVPSVVVAGYYGYKAIKHYRDKKSGNTKDKEEKEGEENKTEQIEETKVIPISRTLKLQEKNKDNENELKEANG